MSLTAEKDLNQGLTTGSLWATFSQEVTSVWPGSQFFPHLKKMTSTYCFLSNKKKKKDF